MKEEYIYWIALAHIPRMKTLRKNELIVRLFEKKKSIIDFFHYDESEWKAQFGLNEKEIELFIDARNELSNYSFLVEDLLNQGYNIIPITSSQYPKTLKNNLKRAYSPPLIYTKGRTEIFNEKSIAIVGSRKATEKSLNFTDSIAKRASNNFEVVVSGFAKGVDKQALDSSIKHSGQSIIVLPQGIMTFNSGFKKYYQQIIEGNVIVLSTFFPKAPWNVKLAMARNPIIYGLANDIYVAESSDKGGTWSGAIDGLRKGRKVFVRIPEANERNANNLLIDKGAIPINYEGNIVQTYTPAKSTEQTESTQKANEIENEIFELLKKNKFTSNEIISKLSLDWNSRKLTAFLKSQEQVTAIKNRPLRFTMQNQIVIQENLFSHANG